MQAGEGGGGRQEKTGVARISRGGWWRLARWNFEA